MNITALIQARMGSTRLPGKVLLDLSGKPMLSRVVERIGHSDLICETVIATTVHDWDLPIVDLCRKNQWNYYCGDEQNVLQRFYNASLIFPADIYLRLTADCPLIDPDVIDRVIMEFIHSEVDYASNTLKLTYPRGLDVEVFTNKALKKTWMEARLPLEFEHVTPYIRNHPEIFKLINVPCGVDYSHMRWTVDTKEDYCFIRKIYNHFKNDTFTWGEVLDLLESYPEWLTINSHIQQKIS